MSHLKKTSADHVDIHRQLLFLAMLLLSLIFAVKLVFYFVNDTVNPYLEIAGKSLFVVFAIILVITIYWKLRFIPKNDRFQLLMSPDSFVMQVMNRACKISWFLTFALLSLVASVTSDNSTALPAGFYLDITFFLMLATFSISFFFLFRAEDEGEHQ